MFRDNLILVHHAGSRYTGVGASFIPLSTLPCLHAEVTGIQVFSSIFTYDFVEGPRVKNCLQFGNRYTMALI